MLFWVQAEQTLDIGRLVGTSMFTVRTRWANVKQEKVRQRDGCCGFPEHSELSEKFRSQTKDLGNRVAEIHSALNHYLVRTPLSTLNIFVNESSYPICTPQRPNGLFKNYANMTTGNSTSNFDDASRSALLAASVYRLVLLTGTKEFVPCRSSQRTVP